MTQTAPLVLPADWRDFFALTKPRVMSLVIFTGLCGLLAAPGRSIRFSASPRSCASRWARAGPAALNQWWEADLDAGMKRTAKRPLPAGRMRADDARDFGIALSVVSVLLMGLAVDWLAAGMLAFSILYYAVVYTIWLKPRTPQNIVIGGGAGAFPPLIGWVCGDRRDHSDAGAAVRDHLLLDPAAFLGARAVRASPITPRSASR